MDNLVSLQPIQPFPSGDILAYALRESSLYIYQLGLRDYVAYCQQQECDPLDPQSLAAWRDFLVEQTEKSPNTINRMMSAVRRITKEAAQRGLIDPSLRVAFEDVPGVKVRKLKERLKRHARTRITPEEMRHLCEAPRRETLLGKRDAALLAVLASSGIRAEEAAHLQLQDIVSRGGGYIIRVQGKTDVEPREAHLSREAKLLIDTWIAARPVASSFLFTAFSTRAAKPSTEPLSDTAIWLIVQKYAKHCGLQHIKPHDFRRFVGTELAKDDIRKAQKALGHKSIETTARHYVLDELEPGLTDDLY